VILTKLAELLKNVLVLLKRLFKPQQWWEQYLPCQGNATNGVQFHLHLSNNQAKPAGHTNKTGNSPKPRLDSR